MNKLKAWFREDGPAEDAVFLSGCSAVLVFCGYVIFKAIQTFM